ncbi:MAG TPA: hypothetical protein VFE92_05205 [Dermatophilaceae bacterium]|nr:hypothetical protein [Dermatophilaceae bacterium]
MPYGGITTIPLRADSGFPALSPHTRKSSLGYFGSEPQNCAGAATIGVTAAAGPLNYVGLNPKMKCKLPQPSS